jgi:hypothetical protein
MNEHEVTMILGYEDAALTEAGLELTIRKASGVESATRRDWWSSPCFVPVAASRRSALVTTSRNSVMNCSDVIA